MTASIHAGPAPTLGLLLIEGPDAAAFLQGQTTQDTRLVDATHSATGALCSAQGRVIALWRLVALPHGLAAVLPQDLVAPVRDRLQRYVLRARVKLIEPGAGLQVVAVLAGSEVALLAGLPGCPREADAVGTLGELAVIRLSGPRALLLGPPAAVAVATAGCAPLQPTAWAAALVAAGEPAVTVATSEHWIPQMLNLDLLGAVSFGKGCYTGQEIVTRTQHLGRIKRRLQRYSAPAGTAFAPAQALYAGADKVAEVVLAADGPAGSELLAVVNLGAGHQSLGSAPGASDLVPLPLPYVVPELQPGG